MRVRRCFHHGCSGGTHERWLDDHVGKQATCVCSECERVHPREFGDESLYQSWRWLCASAHAARALCPTHTTGSCSARTAGAVPMTTRAPASRRRCAVTPSSGTAAIRSWGQCTAVGSVLCAQRNGKCGFLVPGSWFLVPGSDPAGRVVHGEP